MYETTVGLMGQLIAKLLDENAQGLQRDLALEARERLLQLDHLLTLVRQRVEMADGAMARASQATKRYVEDMQHRGLALGSTAQPADTQFTREEGDLLQVAEFEMQLFAECFYYIAGRLRTALRTTEPIPGLGSFECEGARNVRNKLLEHAEKQSHVLIRSFGWSKEGGPILKAVRCIGQEKIFPDQGLYANAQEIKDNLEAILMRILGE
jgi:hypothetical protein